MPDRSKVINFLLSSMQKQNGQKFLLQRMILQLLRPYVILKRFSVENLFSDNATIFKSSQFIKLCYARGIQRRYYAPAHPATNGQAERFCQILKNKLKCLAAELGNIHDKMLDILFHYRTTPLQNGLTPAEQMMGRKSRAKLDLIRPPNSAEKKSTSFDP